MEKGRGVVRQYPEHPSRILVSEQKMLRNAIFVLARDIHACHAKVTICRAIHLQYPCWTQAGLSFLLTHSNPTQDYTRPPNETIQDVVLARRAK
jgi:hypothetical protein